MRRGAFFVLVSIVAVLLHASANAGRMPGSIGGAHTAPGGTTYYVDQDGGSDAADGTTTSTPWATIGKVNGVTFNPGDTILFERGDTWSGTGLVIGWDGTQEAPITFGAYGAVAAQPIISGGGTVVNVISGDDFDYITIQDLNVIGWDDRGIWNQDGHGWTIQRNTVSGGDDVAADPDVAIRVSTTALPLLRNIVIRDNTIGEISNDGTPTQRDNILYVGILTQGTVGAKILHNEIATTNVIGIIAEGDGTNNSWRTEIAHNTIHDCYGGGIALWHGNEARIHDNEIRDFAGMGIGVGSPTYGAGSLDNLIYDNRIHDLTKATNLWNGIDISNTATGGEVWGNHIWAVFRHCLMIDGNSDNWDIHHNVLDASNSTGGEVGAADARMICLGNRASLNTGWVSDHNVCIPHASWDYFGSWPDGTPTSNDDGTLYDLPDWRTNASQDASSRWGLRINVTTSSDATASVVFVDTATGSQAPRSDPGLTYNATTNVLEVVGGVTVGAVQACLADDTNCDTTYCHTNDTGCDTTYVHTDASNTYSTGTQDFTSATITRPFEESLFASFPGTCAAGRDFLVRTDPAVAGQAVYICDEAGTGWALVGDGTASVAADSLTYVETDFSATVASDLAMAVDECQPVATATGGGFLCEGTGLDTVEQYYLFPDVAGADGTTRIVVDATEVTDIDGDGMTIVGGVLGVVGGLCIDATANDIDVTADCINATNLAEVLNLGTSTSFEVPNSATPTTDAFGEIAADNDAWGASRGALQTFDGTASTFVVATLATDTPTNTQVPTWNTGGTITWETPATAPAAANAEPPSVATSTSGTVGTDTSEYANENHSHDLAVHAHTGPTVGGTIATAAIDANAVTRDKVEAELRTEQFCFTLFEPDATQGLDELVHDVPSIWMNKARAITITQICCEADETYTSGIQLQRDDGTPADIMTADLTCNTTPNCGTIAGAEDNVSVTDEIDFLMEADSGTTLNRINVCVTYTVD